MVLTHYNPSLPVKLACDASPYGIGAVMSHLMEDGSERPIAFASWSLSAAEKNYAQIDREALSLVWGVKRFNHYLFDREFTLVMDHQQLTSIFIPQKGIPATAAAHMQRWALFLGGHRYKIEYKCTADMVKTETKRDKILSQVYLATLKSWTTEHRSLLPAYYAKWIKRYNG